MDPHVVHCVSSLRNADVPHGISADPASRNDLPPANRHADTHQYAGQVRIQHLISTPGMNDDQKQTISVVIPIHAGTPSVRRDHNRSSNRHRKVNAAMQIPSPVPRMKPHPISTGNRPGNRTSMQRNPTSRAQYPCMPSQFGRQQFRRRKNPAGNGGGVWWMRMAIHERFPTRMRISTGINHP